MNQSKSITDASARNNAINTTWSTPDHNDEIMEEVAKQSQRQKPLSKKHKLNLNKINLRKSSSSANLREKRGRKIAMDNYSNEIITK